MKDFMIKLVATDMDGTFLDGEGRFDMERLKNLLVSYKEKGIYFAVASGRGILSLKKLFSDVRDEVIFMLSFMGKICTKPLCLGTFTWVLLKS